MGHWCFRVWWRAGNPDTHANGHPDSDSNSDTHADGHPVSNSNSDFHANGNSSANGYNNPNANSRDQPEPARRLARSLVIRRISSPQIAPRC